MSRKLLVNMGIACALIASGGLGDARAVPDSTPSSGSGAAFATTADGMASTVESFIKANDLESAEKSAIELTKHQPDFLRGWMLLGYCQSCNGRFAESNASYEKALALGAESRAIKQRMAYNHIRLGEFDEARDCYRAILELEPDDAETLGQLAGLEDKLGHYDAAAHYYRRVLEGDPDNADALRSLAKVEEKRGGGSAVKELLVQHLEANPDDTESLARLGRIYLKENDFKAAVTPLEHLVALEPDDAKAHRNLGVALYQIGDKTGACGEFQRVRELGGDMSGLYGPLADCYIETGARGEALALVQEGIAAGSQEAWLYCMWGKILEAGQNYDGAITKFTAAAGMNDEPWSTYARKQISRQEKLKKRAELISSQSGMN